jgi:ABC-type transport system substrate-binding protein
LLADSSYDGSVIKLSSNTSTTKAEDQLLAMEGYLEEVGFNIEVEIVENATLLEMRTSGNYDAFLVITMHSANDAGGILYQRVTYDYHKSGYVNEELNNLINQGQQTIDATERGELYKQAAKIMRENSAPHFALYAPNATQAIDYGIVGLELWADGNHCFRYIDFDPDATAWRTCDWASLTAF